MTSIVPSRTGRSRLFFNLLFGLVSGLLATPLWAAEAGARLDWSRSVVLSTPVSGVVSEVPVRVGQQVTRGQVLVRLDPRRYQARVDASQAAIQRILPQQAESRRELERATELYERTVLSDHELELARIARQQADAELSRARAEHAQARWDLEYSAVRAPFAGYVVSLPVEVGQTVVSRTSAPTLVILASDRPLLARLALPLADLQRLTPGAALAVRLGGRELRGKVQHLSRQPLTGQTDQPVYEVLIEVTAASGESPRPGQRVMVQLP